MAQPATSDIREGRRGDAAPPSVLRTWWRGLVPFSYLAPGFLVYAFFFVWPAIQMVRLSFFRWDGVTQSSPAGLSNYIRMIEDPLFWNSFRNTAAWTAFAIVVPVGAGLAAAILLSRSPLFGKTLFRTVFFLPQVISSVVVAVIWGWIYNPSFGALNTSLRSVGLEGLALGWLGDSTLALPALFVAWSWVHYGFTMIIFIAAIDDIDESFFEAAVVDGASFLQQVRYVLVPMIRGPMTTVVLITAIAAFQVFDLVFLMTGGGPGQSTSVLALFMINAAFRFRRVGYGAAIGVALMVMILLMALVLIRVRRAFQEDV